MKTKQKLMRRKLTWQEGLFWTLFGLMLVGMFGGTGAHARMATTTLAALIFVIGCVHVFRQRRRAV